MKYDIILLGLNLHISFLHVIKPRSRSSNFLAPEINDNQGQWEHYKVTFTFQEQFIIILLQLRAFFMRKTCRFQEELFRPLYSSEISFPVVKKCPHLNFYQHIVYSVLYAGRKAECASLIFCATSADIEEPYIHVSV